ncbi:hypothetical protein [Nocardia sp. alder85J]|uniref:hypothetical protein n=1 Tax=Nocardia sp. alder85J TaxID=2862949 RepID=UPI001CD44737|nr:hypothetical protein [Nocardia sp. alder85J]MCX4094226.1 hypothetical protein [Nocardia sp. alder85J]
MERAGPLIAVGVAAEAGEPLIARAAQAGRQGTHENIADLWRRMHADGLLHPDADLEWIISTAGPLGQAETYNLIVRTLGWDPDTYQQWLYGTWLRLATTPSTLTEP